MTTAGTAGTAPAAAARPVAVRSAPRRRVAYRVVCGALDLLVRAACRTSADLRTLPREGPLLVLPNHLSVLDPVVVACVLNRHGLVPRFVITAGVMRSPVVGPVLRFFDHVPLDRTAGAGAGALGPVVRALAAGECVVLYPEGRVAEDPGRSPGRGLPGAAVAAARSGAPVVCLGQWGSQGLWHRNRSAGAKGTSSLLAWPPRRPHVRLLAGAPRQVGADTDGRGVLRTTRELMAELSRLVVHLRATEAAGTDDAAARR